MSSAPRAARWAAQRAANKLANRGDTHFAAEKRLYKKQLKELRKEWLHEDLLARREFYVQQREAKRLAAEQKKERMVDKEETHDAAIELAMAEERQAILEQKEKHKMHARVDKERRVAKRQELDTNFRKKWLDEILQDYDVEGAAPANAFQPQRKRAWLNPENFEKRLHLLLMRSESPVDKWNGIARKLEADEQKASIKERTGGRVQPSSEPAYAPLPGIAASGARPTLPSGAAAAAIGADVADGGSKVGGEAAGPLSVASAEDEVLFKVRERRERPSQLAHAPHPTASHRHRHGPLHQPGLTPAWPYTAWPRPRLPCTPALLTADRLLPIRCAQEFKKTLSELDLKDPPKE